MLRICSRTLVKVGKLKPCHRVKPVSATRVAVRSLIEWDSQPKLPVPPLRQTCESYLNILEPIVSPDELKHTKALVEEFMKPGGLGERLQSGLEEKASNTENWVSNNDANQLHDDYVKREYLDIRKPLPVYSNTGVVHPRRDYRDKQGQIRFAAELTTAVLNIKTMIDKGTLPVERMAGYPLCMKQYDHMLSSCRIPGPKMDSLIFLCRSPNPPKHISVVHNSQFFKMDVYNSDGTQLATDQLCIQLEKICNSSLEPNTEPVGILTTQHRDVWSKTYMELTKDQTNKESLSAIQSSIFTLCLDGTMPPAPDEMYDSVTTHQMLHGRGSQISSGNRWFDKVLQVIVGEDGSCGASFSHAAVDGTVCNGMLNFVVAEMKRLYSILPTCPKSPTDLLPMPQKLHFNITPEIKKDIEDAKQHIDKLAQDLTVSVTYFRQYGRKFLKEHKTSSDAFVQVALQLAYYRMYQECCEIYEPASLRIFRLGRLSSIHSKTNASVAFVKAFDDPKIKNSEKIALLKEAVQAHRLNTTAAVSGQAVHNHLLGLEMQAVEKNIPTPEIFTDTSFAKSVTFNMITNQLKSDTGSVPCVGPEKPGSYTVSYSIRDDYILLVASCSDPTNIFKDKHAIHMVPAIMDTFMDMKTMLQIYSSNSEANLQQ